MIRFLIPLVYILFANASSVCIFKKKFLKLLPLTLLLSVFPLFLSGLIFSSFTIGIIINLLYALYFAFYIVKNKKNQKVLEEFKKNYFTVGIAVFFVLYLFLFIYDYNRNFKGWDEFSHWGVMLKEMFRIDNFYTVKDSTLLVHKDYPPFLQLFEFFFLKLSGGFSESGAIMSVHLLEFSIILSFISEKLVPNVKNILKTAGKTLLIIGIILMTILLFDMHTIMNSIYNDYILSILVAYVMILIMSEKDKTSNSLLFTMSVVSVFLLLTKQVSIAFYMMILFFYAICSYKKIKLDKKTVIKLVVLLIVVPLLFYESWSMFVDRFDIIKQFKISDIKFGELYDVFFNASNAKHVIVTNYVHTIFNVPITVFNLFDMTYFNSFILYSLLVLIFAIKNTKYTKKDMLKYYITILIGFVGYSFLMLILYIFCFGGEGYTLASFNRYMDTYLLIEYLSLFILFMKCNEEKLKVIPYVIVFLAVTLTIQNTYFEKIKPTYSKKNITSEEGVANAIVEKVGEGKKVYLLGQNTDGFYQFAVKYYANPIVTNFYHYNLDTTCEDCKQLFDAKIKNYMSEFEYLYVLNTTDEVKEKYDFVFSNIENGKIYKIIYSNDKIELEEVE